MFTVGRPGVLAAKVLPFCHAWPKGSSILLCFRFSIPTHGSVNYNWKFLIKALWIVLERKEIIPSPNHLASSSLLHQSAMRFQQRHLYQLVIQVVEIFQLMYIPELPADIWWNHAMISSFDTVVDKNFSPVFFSLWWSLSQCCRICEFLIAKGIIAKIRSGTKLSQRR